MRKFEMRRQGDRFIQRHDNSNSFREDIQHLKARLSIEHLTDHTLIFKDYYTRAMSAKEATSRFEQYWKTWIAQSLGLLFDFFEEVTRYEEIPGGVIIHGDGFKRTVMNSWYDGVNTDNL